MPAPPMMAARPSMWSTLAPSPCPNQRLQIGRHARASVLTQASQPSRRDMLQSSIIGTGASLLSVPAAWSNPTAGADKTPTAMGAAGQVARTKLAHDLEVSRVIKGCWQLSGGHRGDSKTDRTAGQAAVEDLGTFARAGITTFDVADHYGPGEQLIGQYLASAPAAERSTVQVLSKLCVFRGSEMSRLSRDYVKQAVDTSRQRLGVDKVDLMQFYWQDYGVRRYTDGIKYLGDEQAEGHIRHVGVTNFDTPRLQEMLATGVNIVSNQVQYSLLDRRPEVAMAAFCGSNGVQLLPYGVLAGGLLSSRYLGLPASEVRLDTYSKGKYASVLQQAGGWAWFQSLLKVLDSVAARYNVSLSNVATRWVLQKPAVAAVILGARNASHISDHQALFTFRLDAQDLAAIAEVLERGKQPTSDCYTWERGGAW